jgi:hypothetical protein
MASGAVVAKAFGGMTGQREVVWCPPLRSPVDATINRRIFPAASGQDPAGICFVDPDQWFPVFDPREGFPGFYRVGELRASEDECV